jgi:hypothetical protein
MPKAIGPAVGLRSSGRKVRYPKRPLAIDETALLRASADLCELHNHLEPAIAHTLLDAGFSLCETTEFRIPDRKVRGSRTFGRAHGKAGWDARDIQFDPWHARVLALVIDKKRRAGAGPSTVLAYGGSAPGRAFQDDSKAVPSHIRMRPGCTRGSTARMPQRRRSELKY